MSIKIDLLIIDPQVDFCSPSGSLSVPGADQDMVRVANLVKRLGNKINDIHVTLDTHHYFDIAHPIFWKGSDGKHPNPFTIISSSDIKNNIWTPSIPSLFKKALDYIGALEKSGRYPLCIWPPHCLIGSEGHKVYPELFEALMSWEQLSAGNMIDYITKGSNFMTEHYSAIKAEVIDPMDPTTQVNTKLIKTLEEADIIAVMGEAKDYCVYNTLKDIINEFTNQNYIKKIVLIEDGMSCVNSLNTEIANFYIDLSKKGITFSKCDDFLS